MFYICNTITIKSIFKMGSKLTMGDVKSHQTKKAINASAVRTAESGALTADGENITWTKKPRKGNNSKRPKSRRK